MIKKLLLFGLVFLLFAVSAFAQDFDFSVTPIDNQIWPNESASFLVSVTNNREVEIMYEMSSQQAIAAWDISSEPILYEYKTFKVPAQSTRNITLKFRSITSSVSPGTKKLILDIESEKGVAKSQEILILMLGAAKLTYSPNLLIRAMDVPPDPIDPTLQHSFYFNIINKNSLDLPEVYIKLKSRLVKESLLNFSMEPYGQKLLQIVPAINPYAGPGKDTLVITLLTENGEKIKEYEREIEIKENDIPYEGTEIIERSFLKAVYTYQVHNPSNLKKMKSYQLPTSYFDRIFSYPRPKTHTVRVDGVQYYSWDMELEPDETVTITVIRSHRSLLYLAIIVLFLLIVYYSFKPDLAISKKAMKVVVQEGGFSESTIRINLKNLTGNKLDNVRIVDTIPNIAEYVSENTAGMVSPANVKVFDRGTTLEWFFDELSPREERVITYKIRSKLTVVGVFKIEATVASYTKKGKKKTSYSNAITLHQ